MSTFEFMSNPVMPGQQIQQTMNNQQMYPAQVYQPPLPSAPQTIEGSSFGFKVVPDAEEEAPINSKMVIKSPITDTVVPTEGKRRGRPKKEEAGNIIKAEGTVEDNSSIYTYNQTTMMLQDTVSQLDMIAGEVKTELDAVRLSKTYRNKYNTMVGLVQGLSKILETKVSAISQINNSISKANDLDYKREKDRKAMEANAAADDKYIMDLYSSFIKNPMGNTQQDVLGPNITSSTLLGNNIIRADVPNSNNDGTIPDAGYLNYLSNITPEQNMMFYENNPNVKTVVVYDASNGNKFFQVMDISTNQVIPNVPVLDNRFLEDTYIDIKNKIAKNTNLRQSYPVIVINEGITSEY